MGFSQVYTPPAAGVLDGGAFSNFLQTNQANTKIAGGSLYLTWSLNHELRGGICQTISAHRGSWHASQQRMVCTSFRMHPCKCTRWTEDVVLPCCRCEAGARQLLRSAVLHPGAHLSVLLSHADCRLLNRPFKHVPDIHSVSCTHHSEADRSFFSRDHSALLPSIIFIWAKCASSQPKPLLKL